MTAPTQAEAAFVAPWDMPRFRNWIMVPKVTHIVERAMAADLVPLGLKVPHYDILANIARYPGLTQQELADRLLVGRSNMSMLLPELERRGLIARVADEGDRRVRRLKLTPEGEALTRQALALHVALIERMMLALDAAECEQLGDYMRRIRAHLQDEKGPATP